MEANFLYCPLIIEKNRSFPKRAFPKARHAVLLLFVMTIDSTQSILQAGSYLLQPFVLCTLFILIPTLKGALGVSTFLREWRSDQVKKRCLGLKKSKKLPWHYHDIKFSF